MYMPTLKIQSKPVGEFIVYSLQGELIVSTIQVIKQAFLNDLNAKKAYFDDGKLYFDGSLSAKEATVK